LKGVLKKTQNVPFYTVPVGQKDVEAGAFEDFRQCVHPKQLLQGRITARNNAYVSCQCVNLSRMSCSDPRILTSSPQVHFNRRLVRLRFCMLVPAPQSPQHEKARCKHGQGEG